MTLETTLEEHLEKTVQTLNKLRNSIKEESKFVFTLVWMLVDKFIADDEMRKRLSNILSDNMRLLEECMQRKYDEGKQEGEKRGEKNGFERGEKSGFVKGEKSGFEKGWDEKGLEVAEELLNDNLSLERISQVTDVPIGHLELLNEGKL